MNCRICGATIEASSGNCGFCGETVADRAERRWSFFTHQKRWRVVWREHVVNVTNWWNLFFSGGCSLGIDGEVVDAHVGRGLGINDDLHGQIRESDGILYEVRAHLGSIHWGLAVGCLIYIDDQVVGGDVSQRFLT